MGDERNGVGGGDRRRSTAPVLVSEDEGDVAFERCVVEWPGLVGQFDGDDLVAVAPGRIDRRDRGVEMAPGEIARRAERRLVDLVVVGACLLYTSDAADE